MFLERFHGSTVDYHLSLGETEPARIFFTVHVERGGRSPRCRTRSSRPRSSGWPGPGTTTCETRSWRVGPERGARLAEKYAARFPDYYKSNRDWALVVDDVHISRSSSARRGFVVGIGNEATGERLTRVKLYKTGGKVDLSAFMPMLESLGLRVVEEIPIAMLGEGRVYIHDFGVLDCPRRGARPGTRRARRSKRSAPCGAARPSRTP